MAKLADDERDETDEDEPPVRERRCSARGRPDGDLRRRRRSRAGAAPQLRAAANASARSEAERAATFDAARRGARRTPPSGGVADASNAALIARRAGADPQRRAAAPPLVPALVYAPGFYTGYGVKTLPGVREAIEQREWTEAEQQAVQAAGAIVRAAGILRSRRRLSSAANSQ